MQEDYATAAGRSCDNQHNSCADVANNQDVANVTVSDCDTQNSEFWEGRGRGRQTHLTPSPRRGLLTERCSRVQGGRGVGDADGVYGAHDLQRRL